MPAMGARSRSTASSCSAAASRVPSLPPRLTRQGARYWLQLSQEEVSPPPSAADAAPLPAALPGRCSCGAAAAAAVAPLLLLHGPVPAEAAARLPSPPLLAPVAAAAPAVAGGAAATAPPLLLPPLPPLPPRSCPLSPAAAAAAATAPGAAAAGPMPASRRMAARSVPRSSSAAWPLLGRITRRAPGMSRCRRAPGGEGTGWGGRRGREHVRGKNEAK
jgi:hypothetical protein